MVIIDSAKRNLIIPKKGADSHLARKLIYEHHVGPQSLWICPFYSQRKRAESTKKRGVYKLVCGRHLNQPLFRDDVVTPLLTKVLRKGGMLARLAFLFFTARAFSAASIRMAKDFLLLCLSDKETKSRKGGIKSTPEI